MLNEYLSAMSAAAVEHGGTVDKFVGDAVMVVFGAPNKADERTQSMAAVKTALAMHAAVENAARCALHMPTRSLRANNRVNDRAPLSIPHRSQDPD